MPPSVSITKILVFNPITHTYTESIDPTIHHTTVKKEGKIVLSLYQTT